MSKESKGDLFDAAKNPSINAAKTQKPATAQQSQIAKSVEPIKGLENFDRQDLIIPRVIIGQGLSSAVADGFAKMGDIINNLTNEVIGEAKEQTASIEVIPVYFTKSRVCYAPRDEEDIQAILRRIGESGEAAEKQFRDRGVMICSSPDARHGNGDFGPGSKWNPSGRCIEMDASGIIINQCPMATWIRNGGGRDEPPYCVFFRNVFVLIRGYDVGHPLAVSFGRTSEKAGKQFVNLIHAMCRGGSLPIWSHAYTLKTKFREEGGNKWYEWRASLSGKATPEEQAQAEAYYELMKSSSYVIHEGDESAQDEVTPDDEPTF